MDGILAVAGIFGILDNRDDFYEVSDFEGEAWRNFVNTWWDNYQGQEVGVSDLYRLAVDGRGNPTDLDLGNGSLQSQKSRLGKMLAANRDRQFDGIRIVKVGTRQRAGVWQLVQCNS